MKPPNDRAIFMISIGIALVFWLFVKLSKSYTVWRDLELVIELPEGKALVSLPPENIEVNIKAKGWDLLFHSNALANLTQHYSFGGKEVLSVPKWQLNTHVLEGLPTSRIKVKDINCNDIQLQLEHKLEKKVPLILNKSITFAEGFNRAGHIVLEPDSIVVSGPQSMVEGILYWETDSLLATDLKESIDKDINLKVGKKELHLSQQQVLVHLPVEKYTEKIFFIPLVIHNIPQEDSLSIFPKIVNIRCVVGLSRYEDLEAEDFSVEVNLNVAHLSEGKNTTPIVLAKQPDFVKGINFTPKAATFYMIKKEEVENTSN